MKNHLLSILSIVLSLGAMVLFSSCEKMSYSRIRNLRAEAIDATTARIEFDVTLSEEDLRSDPYFLVIFSAQGDPKELPDHTPGLLRFNAGPSGQNTMLKAGSNHMVSMAYNLPTSQKGYKGYIRVKEFKLVNEETGYHESHWSGLETVKVPKIGDPYVRDGSFEDITSTSATVRFIWAGNGQRISYLSCIYSTDRKDVENNIGTKVGQYNHDPTKMYLTDLTPGTTYYVRARAEVMDIWTGEITGIYYSKDIYSFTTLEQ